MKLIRYGVCFYQVTLGTSDSLSPTGVIGTKSWQVICLYASLCHHSVSLIRPTYRSGGMRERDYLQKALDTLLSLYLAFVKNDVAKEVKRSYSSSSRSSPLDSFPVRLTLSLNTNTFDG